MTSPKKMKTSIELYSYWRSSCSWRVRIGLAIKGLKYDYVAIHLVEKKQFGPDYTQVNPNQRLPTLKIDGETLTQSQAILEYLEERNPEPSFFPSELKKKVKVREICGIIGCDIQPVQNLAVLKAAMALVSDEDKTSTKMNWGKDWITRGFVAVEALIATTAGKYCVGDEISLADVFLYPQVYNAKRFKVDLKAFPTIERIQENLLLHEAFIASDPKNMPDADN